MSTVSGNWEVVGGKSGKKKHAVENGNKMNKNQKKKVIDNMPRLKESDPIKETQTIFEAFLEKDRKHEESQKKDHSNAKSNGTAEPAKAGKKAPNKKKDKEKKDTLKDPLKVNSFEELASEVSCVDLRLLLENVKATFPDSPSVWMKDLASFLNLKLSCDLPDPTFHGKPRMYPTSLMSAGIHSLLVGTIKVCTPQTLHLFFEHCLTSLVQDMINNLPTYGYRIFLQCLASEKPELVISSLPKFVDLRNTYQNRHNVCLSLLWVAGQAGLTDISKGLKVWLELMFPVVSMRAFSKFTVDYLETLFKCQSNAKSAIDVLGVREFFPVFDFLYSPIGNHGSSHHKQLLALYPRLKSLAYGADPSSILCNFFPSYLNRLQPASQPAMKQELLESLVECLAKDKHCYSVWRQLYTKHLVQSSLLLDHLSKHHDRLPSGFPHKMLKETLHTFKVTNDEFSAQHKTSLDGYADCVRHCNDLLPKMSVWRFPWRLLFLLIVASAAALVVYDINLHGSFKASKTGKLLKEYGVLAVWQQAWGKISVYSRKTYRWMEKNVPVYYGQLCQNLGPYIQQFWESVTALAVYLWQASLPAREWFNVNVPPLLQNVSDNLPVLLGQLSTWLGKMLEVAQDYAVYLWKQAAILVLAIGTWLQEHVFTGAMSVDSLQRLAGNAIGQVQVYTQSALKWLTQMVSNA